MQNKAGLKSLVLAEMTYLSADLSVKIINPAIRMYIGNSLADRGVGNK